MAQAQEPWCFDFLKEEIAIYKPKRVLFMTGIGWVRQFLEHVSFEEKKIAKGERIEMCGKIELPGNFSTDVVVIPHPQSKSQKEPIEQAAECFKQLMRS